MFNTHPINSVLAQFSIELPKPITLSTNSLIKNDSRIVEQGDVFCAVIGTESDGRNFINAALANNAGLVIAECESEAEHGDVQTLTCTNGASISQVSFFRLNQQLFELASAFYNYPQQRLSLIGITGTNGKTSISQLTANLLNALHNPCAVIGTNGAGLPNALTEITNTTPGATELLAWLNKFDQQKIAYVAMEVSSHGLSQKRVDAALFDVAVFSNLSRDHLDYHGTMENYAEAKYQLFTQKGNQTAVVNGDDQQAKTWLRNWPSAQPVIVYGRSYDIANHAAYVQATNIRHSKLGASFTLHTHLGDIEINSALLGDFNIDNLLAAIAVLLTQQATLVEIAAGVSTLMPITGRMEAYSHDNLATTVVDYAHTPDGLKNALQACRQHCQGQLWVVFGCGGDRDKGKRPLMGAVAEQWADRLVITNDNPRKEQPQSIADEILAGCKHAENITLELDRQQAVEQTIKLAKPNDVVLLAGKGHENYIIIGDEKRVYDERALVSQLYKSEATL